MNRTTLISAAGGFLMGAALVGCTGSSPRFTFAHAVSSAEQPSEVSDSYQEGVASYYAHEFNGRKTSNGETFDMNQLTAAHRTLPFNTKVRVTNLANGRATVVRINDRGPFKDNRIIDLSLAAAKEIGLIVSGTARVKIEVLEWGNSSSAQ